MAEVNDSAIRENGNPEVEKESPTPMQEMNKALKACKFGRFHVRLLLTALFGRVSSILITSSIAYILPNAECDLNMSLSQKGLLSAVPFLGMIIASVAAGFLSDQFGRKKFLLVGYGGIFIFTFIGGSSQTYNVLLTTKFFEGILFATSFNPTLTLTSEFLYPEIRDRVMLLQASYAAVSQVIIALMSWGILTQDWRLTLFNGYIVLNPWNFYMFIGSLWSLTAFTLYIFLPESPKYLITQKKYHEAREILIQVYKENTGLPAESYPYFNLWRDRKEYVLDVNSRMIQKSISSRLVTGLHNVKPLFRNPLIFIMGMICLLMSCNLILYNVLRMWFPQLSTIVEHYSTEHNGLVDDLCVMLDSYTGNQKTISGNGTRSQECVPVRSGTETYINTVIFGCVCFLPLFISGVLVNKVGKKRLLIATGLINTAATLGLKWTSSKVAVVALFSIDSAVAQTSLGLYQAFIVQYFPTAIRSVALSLIMTVGRLGIMIGNIAFPILLGLGCAVPFFALAGMMLCASVISIFLPNKKT